MQHAPTAISNTAFNRGVTPEAGAPGLCFGTLHFAFLTLYSGSIRWYYQRFCSFLFPTVNGYNYIFTYGSAVCLHTRTAYFALPRSLPFLRSRKASALSHAPYSLYRAPLFPNKNTGSEFSFAAGVNLMIAHVTL